METTPMIPIDDAYIGICMLKAGFTDYIFNDGRFRSWGLERKADVCLLGYINNNYIQINFLYSNKF